MLTTFTFAAWLACTAARPPLPQAAPPSEALTSCHEGTEGCDPYLEGLDTGDEVARRRAAVLRYLRCRDRSGTAASGPARLAQPSAEQATESTASRDGDRSDIAEACRWWRSPERADELLASFPRDWSSQVAEQLCQLDPSRCADSAGITSWDLGDAAETFDAWSVGERDLVVASGTTIAVWDGLGRPTVVDLTERPLDARFPPAIGALSATDGTLRAAIDPRGLPLSARNGVPRIPVFDGRRTRWVGDGATRICPPFGDADPEGFVATLGQGARCPVPLDDAPRARFDWSGQIIGRVEGLSSGFGGRLRPRAEETGRRAIVEQNTVRVVEADGTELLPRTEIPCACVIEVAVVSGDASRVFVLGYPGHLHAIPLRDELAPGPGLELPQPDDGWLARGVAGDEGRIEGRIPRLGRGGDVRGPVVVETMVRVGGRPVHSVTVEPDADGRFSVSVPYGEYLVRAPGFRGVAEVLGSRVEVENEELLVSADLAPGDALHWSGAAEPIRSEERITLQVTPPAAIERADGSRHATSIWGDWTELRPESLRPYEVRWDTGEPIAGATVLLEGLAGTLQAAAGRAVADGGGRGWLVTPSRPASLRVDGELSTWPMEPERFLGELRWTVPRSSLVADLDPGQLATLAHDTRDLVYTFVPDGDGWLVRQNDEPPGRRQEVPRLDFVPPGPWTLTAWDPDGRVARVGVMLEQGAVATVRPQWKRAGGVRVVVVDPSERRVPGARVEAVSVLSRTVRGETNELGEVVLDGLPPGRVTLRVRDYATRYRAVVGVDVEPRRTVPVLAEVRVPSTHRGYPGIEFGHACIVRDPGDWRGALDGSDRIVRIGERGTAGWSADDCTAAFHQGVGPRTAIAEGLRGRRDLAFPGPPRCASDGTCVQRTRRGERVLRRGPI